MLPKLAEYAVTFIVDARYFGKQVSEMPSFGVVLLYCLDAPAKIISRASTEYHVE